ncbi:MAG: peroxiredoxin [Planctomycetes bacterium]|nr:peroxiredoxin [Planctomycetota bacterium]
MQARGFRHEFARFEQLGAAVVGVSSDSVHSHDAWADKECLPFPLLADDDGRVRTLYGVPRSLFGLLPGRLTFVIAVDGRIRAIVGHQLRLHTHVRRAREAVESVARATPQLARH